MEHGIVGVIAIFKGGRVGQTLLVDFGIEWLAFELVLSQLLLKLLRLFVHVGFVFERLLVQLLVFFLSDVKAFLESLVVFKFENHLVLKIGCAHELVRNLDLVESALLQ